MIGILLINLGTPKAPTESAVHDYLDVFLSDPYIITLPKILRDFLVQKLILPKRSKTSAEAYKKIWTPNGSPLLVNSLALQEALQKQLGDDYFVALGMRYSKPSILDAIQQLKSCEKIIVLPLFPQFSRATTQSALDIVVAHTDPKNTIIIPDFYDQDFYINALSALIEKNFDRTTEFLLLSYHGLPKRQIDSDNYRTQCYKTAELLAKKLNLSEDNYFVTFQSRLGFTKWISPYTDKSLKMLREKGVENLSVACPSFVADCIETLEEIDMRLREQWVSLGGKSFRMTPCLNNDNLWVEQLATYLKMKER
ncbi:MAG: ferrochelatase [Coxiellaceae bacterium]|nr:ferrochelatase [Coxiellaceae bacterium]